MRDLRGIARGGAQRLVRETDAPPLLQQVLPVWPRADGTPRQPVFAVTLRRRGLPRPARAALWGCGAFQGRGAEVVAYVALLDLRRVEEQLVRASPTAPCSCRWRSCPSARSCRCARTPACSCAWQTASRQSCSRRTLSGKASPGPRTGWASPRSAAAARPAREHASAVASGQPTHAARVARTQVAVCRTSRARPRGEVQERYHARRALVCERQKACTTAPSDGRSTKCDGSMDL